MNESAPIPIIVGALVTLLVVGIAAGILNGFGKNLSSQSDYQEIAKIASEIEEACKTFENDETENIFFDTVTTVNMRDSGLNINNDPSNGDLMFNLASSDSDSEEDDDTELNTQRTVKCSEASLELSNSGGIDLLSGQIDRGEYEFITEANYEDDKVIVSAREK